MVAGLGGGVPGDGCAVAPSGCISCTHVQTRYLHTYDYSYCTCYVSTVLVLQTGLTPLMEAASGGYHEVGRILVEHVSVWIGKLWVEPSEGSHIWIHVHVKCPTPTPPLGC